MVRLFKSSLKTGRYRPYQSIIGLIGALALCITACSSHAKIRIAVIPQTEGNQLWDPAHEGAENAADPAGISVYWNAPTREDDIEAQISLVDRAVAGNYQGLVLAPNQALSLITPVRRALARGMPTVIIGSPLPIAPEGDLIYVLNDDEAGGRIAAQRVAKLLNGHGAVALLGINPDITGIMIRSRAFEKFLAQNDPGIRIVEKRMGTFNVAHEQQEAEEALRANPSIGVVVALMWPTIDGTVAALQAIPEIRRPKIVGFDPAGDPPFQQGGNFDSVIRQDTRSMAREAIELIHMKLLGKPVPSLVLIQPKLITGDNINSPEVRSMVSTRDWHWSLAQ